ncbi:hypothetical protein M7I_0785 [Glarea lozoyensis 74030]|uniref:Uncharacterized protein n=1 Tax=Glarea lozoyensis (strain ATCC 74030 / MF5533) TaxID=1104152 RepID=H0EEB1_GLAL7|nr:hypothetical protein M7I_0785 [Glarea lozoyensis 74030]
MPRRYGNTALNGRRSNLHPTFSPSWNILRLSFILLISYFRTPYTV